jgi:hypothetical protein
VHTDITRIDLQLWHRAWRQNNNTLLGDSRRHCHESPRWFRRFGSTVIYPYVGLMLVTCKTQCAVMNSAIDKWVQVFGRQSKLLSSHQLDDCVSTWHWNSVRQVFFCRPSAACRKRTVYHHHSAVSLSSAVCLVGTVAKQYLVCIGDVDKWTCINTWDNRLQAPSMKYSQLLGWCFSWNIWLSAEQQHMRFSDIKSRYTYTMCSACQDPFKNASATHLTDSFYNLNYGGKCCRNV